MYILPEMVHLGLPKGQKWPSAAHIRIAENVCLCNPIVRTRDQLIEMVQAIIAIPKDVVKQVTWIDLATKYNVPYLTT